MSLKNVVGCVIIISPLLEIYVMKSNANALGQGEHWSFTSASIVLRHKFHFTYGPWIRTKVDDGGTGGQIGGHFSFVPRKRERKNQVGP